MLSTHTFEGSQNPRSIAGAVSDPSAADFGWRPLETH